MGDSTEKHWGKVRIAAAVLGFFGLANFGDVIRFTRSFFGARVSEAPALVQERKERMTADSAMVDTVKTVRYELLRVKTQNMYFQALQAEVDPDLRAALRRASTETQARKARRDSTVKLLEGLGDENPGREAP